MQTREEMRSLAKDVEEQRRRCNSLNEELERAMRESQSWKTKAESVDAHSLEASVRQAESRAADAERRHVRSHVLGIVGASFQLQMCAVHHATCFLVAVRCGV